MTPPHPQLYLTIHMHLLLSLDLFVNLATFILVLTCFIIYLIPSSATRWNPTSYGPLGYPEPWVATREDLRSLYEARKSRRQAAVEAAAVASRLWQEAMSGPQYPQTLYEFAHLPTEIKIEITRLSIKEVLGQKCTQNMKLFDHR